MDKSSLVPELTDRLSASFADAGWEDLARILFAAKRDGRKKTFPSTIGSERPRKMTESFDLVVENLREELLRTFRVRLIEKFV